MCDPDEWARGTLRVRRVAGPVGAPPRSTEKAVAPVEPLQGAIRLASPVKLRRPFGAIAWQRALR